jgi:HK97 gp10 family phage protein
MAGGSVRVNVDINVGKLGAIFRRSGSKYVSDFTADVVSEARAIVPVDTGRLRDSIKAEPVKTTGIFHMTSGVVATAPYARYVHEGTRPHIIRARNAKALHFYWDKVGGEVFFKSVNHPGTKARPFLRTAGRTVAARR